LDESGTVEKVGEGKKGGLSGKKKRGEKGEGGKKKRGEPTGEREATGKKNVRQ